MNYANRNAEYKDGSDQPKYASMFFRTPGSFVGHGQSIVRPKASEQLDYEGEICLVIGKEGQHIARSSAMEHVAGYTLCNEGTIRDWVRHAKFNVTQGKNFDASGSLGPYFVSADEIDPTEGAAPDDKGQRRDAAGRYHREPDLRFLRSARLHHDLHHPQTRRHHRHRHAGGGGARFDPPKGLKPGDVVEVTVPELGTLSNRVVDE